MTILLIYLGIGLLFEIYGLSKLSQKIQASFGKVPDDKTIKAIKAMPFATIALFLFWPVYAYIQIEKKFPPKKKANAKKS
jgi:hypothetical protein